VVGDEFRCPHGSQLVGLTKKTHVILRAGGVKDATLRCRLDAKGKVNLVC
jgi:hypothetical protein